MPSAPRLIDKKTPELDVAGERPVKVYRDQRQTVRRHGVTDPKT